MKREPWMEPAVYPEKRYEPPEGFCFEVWPLTGARGRIIVTDGDLVTQFW